MSTLSRKNLVLRRAPACSLALMLVMVPWVRSRADSTVDEHTPADANGIVEVIVPAGSVDIRAWDRPEVQVTGKFDESVERLDVTPSHNRTSVNVVSRGREGMRGGGEASLVIHVPAASSVSVSVVTADVKMDGLRGDVKVQTISGNVSGDVGGDLRASTVNGSVNLTAHDARMTVVKTISGDVRLSGGGGEAEITTVSGTATLTFGALTRATFRSISGDVSADLNLAPGARLDGESVSGNMAFQFAAPPDAEFDVQSFSGKIDNCFGPPPGMSRYGTGSRLGFNSGNGLARVRLDTKSGDVRLCVKGRSS